VSDLLSQSFAFAIEEGGGEEKEEEEYTVKHNSI
jgi:hypothetical protein